MEPRTFNKLIWGQSSRKDIGSDSKGIKMCEFSVLLQDKNVFKDAVYAKVEGNKVTVKNILGVSKIFENCIIGEVDVQSERLILQTAKK